MLNPKRIQFYPHSGTSLDSVFVQVDIIVVSLYMYICLLLPILERQESLAIKEANTKNNVSQWKLSRLGRLTLFKLSVVAVQ